MHVTIETLVGKRFSVQCKPADTILSLMKKIEEIEGIPGGLSSQELEQKDIEMTNRFNDWINGTGDCPKYAVKFEDPDPEHPGDYLVRRKRMSTFEKLVERVRRREGMSEEDACDACIAYVRFLELKQSTEDKDGRKLSPPEFIDKIWHLHILDTVNYARDTAWFSDSLADNNGPSIMHDPDRSFDSHSTKRARARNTVLAYQIRFGPKPEKAQKRFWQFPEFDGIWKPKLELDKDIPWDLSNAKKTNKVSNNQQRLIYQNRQLDKNRSIASYGIKDGATIHLVLLLSGC